MTFVHPSVDGERHREVIMSKIIGIDLGTTNSCVAIMEGGSPRCSSTRPATASRPRSSASPTRASDLIGQPAKHQQVTNPKNTVFSIKRFMGRRRTEGRSAIRATASSGRRGEGALHHHGRRGRVRQVKVNQGEFTPQQVSAFILQDLKKTPRTTSARRSTAR
jgi:molecular chaperone DnaK